MKRESTPGLAQGIQKAAERNLWQSPQSITRRKSCVKAPQSMSQLRWWPWLNHGSPVLLGTTSGLVLSGTTWIPAGSLTLGRRGKSGGWMSPVYVGVREPGWISTLKLRQGLGVPHKVRCGVISDNQHSSCSSWNHLKAHSGNVFLESTWHHHMVLDTKLISEAVHLLCCDFCLNGNGLGGVSWDRDDFL